MDDDLRLATQKQREEVMAAKALADDLDLSFHLQMKEAITVSLVPHTSSPEGALYEAEAGAEADDETKWTDLLLGDLNILDQESEDRLLAQQMTNDGKISLDRILEDNQLARRIEVDDKKQSASKRRVSKLNTTLGESSSSSTGTGSETFLLYCKGLVSLEEIESVPKQFGGVGVSICDPQGHPRLEMMKHLGDEESTDKNVAELAAIVHGLEWALELGIQSVKLYCDDPEIMKYVKGEASPNDSAVAALVAKVALLQSRFSSCRALEGLRSNTSVLKLARAAIASQARWVEGGIYMETCPLCFESVQCDAMHVVRGCCHRICLECMRRLVNMSLESNQPLQCPCDGCGLKILTADCEAFGDPHRIKLMMERETMAQIPVQDRVYCQNRDCNQLMSRRSVLRYSVSFFLDAEQSGARKCQKCGFCFCINCKGKWHYGITCDAHRKTKAFRESFQGQMESAADKFGWRKCEECDTLLHLVDGCKHMICGFCKHEFCYTCGAAWKNKKATCKCLFRV